VIGALNRCIFRHEKTNENFLIFNAKNQYLGVEGPRFLPDRDFVVR